MGVIHDWSQCRRLDFRDLWSQWQVSFPWRVKRLRGLVIATGDTSVDSVAGVFPRPGQRPGGLVLATVDLKNIHYPLVPEVSSSTSLTHSKPYSYQILLSSDDHQTLEHKFSSEFQA